MVNKGQGKAKSFLILFCFLLWEQGDFQSLGSQNSSEKSSPSLHFSISDFIKLVSSSYGSIYEKYQDSKERFIFHIQDPHAQFEAQKNIAQVLALFAKALPKGVKPIILVEGAEGMVDVSPLACIQDRDTRDRICTYFLKKGWLSGSEYYAALNLAEPFLFGIDERELYLKNLDYFKKAQSFKKDFLEKIQTIRDSFEKARKTFLSKELLILNDRERAYDQGEISLVEYTSFLKRNCKKKGYLSKKYPFLSKFLHLLRLQKQLDVKATGEEIKRLLESLQARLHQKNLEKLVEKTLLQKLNKISQSDFILFLYDLSLQEKIDWAHYSNLKKFIKILSIQDGISSPLFSKELKFLAQDIRSSLYRHQDEKELDQFFCFLTILENFSQLNLSHEDYNAYLESKGLYPIKKWKELMEKFNPQSSSLFQGDFLSDLLKKCSVVEGFYKTALKRDQAILSKTFQKMKEENTSFAVLVTGGFHTPGLTKGFKREHISYVVMTPSIPSQVSDFTYLSIMNGVLTPFDSGFKSLSQALAPASSFALDPFGNTVSWDVILAQAMIFQEFLEKVRETKGESLMQAYEHFVKTATLSPSRRRFPISEVSKRLELMRKIASQLEIDWENAFFLSRDLFVIVKVGKAKRVIRIKKRPLNEEDDAAMEKEVFEEMGQLGEDISFYVLPKNVVDLLEGLSRISEDLSRTEEGEYIIQNVSREKALKFFDVEQLHQLGKMFPYTRGIHVSVRVENLSFSYSSEYFWPRTLAFIDGQIQALRAQIDENPNPENTMEARIALMKIYHDLTIYDLSIEGDRERALDHCAMGLYLARTPEGEEILSSEIRDLERQLMDLSEKLNVKPAPSPQETYASVWEVFYDQDRDPMAFVLEEDPDLEKEKAQALERMEWLGRMAVRGFQKGDAVFLNGTLAYPFLKAKDLLPNEFQISDELVQLAKRVIQSFEDKGVELYLPLDYTHHVGDRYTNISAAEWEKGMVGDLGENTIKIYSDVLQQFEHVVALGDKFPLVNMGNGKSKGMGKILWAMMKDKEKRGFHFIGPQWEEERDVFRGFSKKGAQHLITVTSLPEKHALSLFEGIDGILREVRKILEGPLEDIVYLNPILKGLEYLPELRFAVRTELSRYVLNQVMQNFHRYDLLDVFFEEKIWNAVGISSNKARDIDQVRRLIEENPIALLTAFLCDGPQDKESNRLAIFECLSKREVRVANILAFDLRPDLPNNFLGDEDRVDWSIVEKILHQTNGVSIVDQAA